MHAVCLCRHLDSQCREQAVAATRHFGKNHCPDARIYGEHQRLQRPRLISSAMCIRKRSPFHRTPSEFIPHRPRSVQTAQQHSAVSSFEVYSTSARRHHHAILARRAQGRHRTNLNCSGMIVLADECPIVAESVSSSKFQLAAIKFSGLRFSPAAHLFHSCTTLPANAAPNRAIFPTLPPAPALSASNRIVSLPISRWPSAPTPSADAWPATDAAR
jgi:hypothetical protein